MRLSKTAYYADFGIYALVVTGAFIWAITLPNFTMRLKATAASVVGGVVWTLVEYVLHRFVFHGVSPIAALHAMHHVEPRAYIGTPTWLSAGVIVGFIFLPVWFAFSLPVAAGFSAGFAQAFLWYGIAHHLIHHGAPHLLAPLLQGTAKRHSRHHRSLGNGNFGVTTEIWDRVFGTRLIALKQTSSARIFTGSPNGN